MARTTITLDTSKGQLVPYVFGQATIAADQTSTQLPAAIGESGTTVDGYAMPFDGEIVAIGWTSDQAASAGEAALVPSIDGVAFTVDPLIVLDDTEVSLRIPRGRARFTHEQRLGCELTTDSGWAGTAADAVVVVYVLHQLEGI
jgi:hypothetical protein